jgi:aspartate/methionine/tyrosine aminotransferase
VKLSSRYPWSAPANRLTLACRAARQPLADLSVSNPTQAGLPPPQGLWADPSSSAYRPSALGDAAAREAIAKYYREQFAIELDPSSIQLCASTSEGYSFCLKLLADPGDEVLIPQPSYPLLEHLLRAEGVAPVPYLTHHAAGQWILDRQRLMDSLTSKTRAVVLVHPNNPTGHSWSAEDLAWLERSLPEPVALLSDEVFLDYTWSGRGETLAGRSRVFCLSGLSKVCAIPQMKLGWIVLPPDPLAREGMEFIADTYLSVSAPIAERAPAWLAQRAELQSPIRERCQENLAFLSPHALPVAAGWTAIVAGEGSGEEEARVLRMIERGYWLQPGFYYELPLRESYVFSLLTPSEVLRAGWEAFISCGR